MAYLTICRVIIVACVQSDCYGLPLRGCHLRHQKTGPPGVLLAIHPDSPTDAIPDGLSLVIE